MQELNYSFAKLADLYKKLDLMIKAAPNVRIVHPKLTYLWEVLHEIFSFFNVLMTFEEGIRNIEELFDLVELRDKVKVFSDSLKATVGAIEKLEKNKGGL